MEKIVFDIECLPNFFCLVVYNWKGEKHIVFKITQYDKDHLALINFVKKFTIVGYNNHNYDDALVQYIIMNPNCTNIELYRLSKLLIKQAKHRTDEERYFVNKFKYNKTFDSIDVMTMIASSKLRVSLKHLQVVTKWKNVEEFECDWDSELPEERWDACINYCKNDVLSLLHVCEFLEKDFKLRDYVQRTTGIECRSKDPVKIAEYAMCKAISPSNTDKWIRKTVKDNRRIEKLVIKDLILPFIEFKTDLFKEVLAVYKKLVLIPEEEVKKKDDDKFGHPIRFNNMWLVFGLGGIHHNYGKKTGKKKFKPKGITHLPKDDELLLMPDVNY